MARSHIPKAALAHIEKRIEAAKEYPAPAPLLRRSTPIPVTTQRDASSHQAMHRSQAACPSFQKNLTSRRTFRSSTALHARFFSSQYTRQVR